MIFADAPYAALLKTHDRVGDEVRNMFYVRREGEGLENGFLPAYGIATTQGVVWRR